MDFKDPAALTHGDLLKQDVQNKRKFFLGYVVPLYMSDEKDCAYDNVSSNLTSCEVTGNGDENSSMDIWSDYSIESPN